MTGKSVDYLVFVGDPVFSVAFSKTTNNGKATQGYSAGWNADYSFTVNTRVEIYTNDVHGLGDGIWKWIAFRSGVQLTSAYWAINPLTGSMSTGYAASPYDMMSATSVTGPGWAVSYGFYDAGSSWDGSLTNHDQSWVYVTPAVETIMADVTSMKNGAMKSRTLEAFVLAGAHDAGTYGMSKMQAICADPGLLEIFKKMIRTDAEKGLLDAVLTGLADTLMAMSSSEILKMVQDFAVTQKDEVSTMLDLGIRYFDFRPGYCPSAIRTDDGIYHQHTCIPGVLYADFITDAFRWLSATDAKGGYLHAGEIVVVSLNSQGFADPAGMAPGVDALDRITAQGQADGCAGAKLIEIGGLDDLQTPYDDLIAANRRVIFLNQLTDAVNGIRDTNSTAKYDSYDAAAYKTLDSASVIARLGTMSVNGQQGNDYTVMQLQATAQGVASADADTVTDNSWSGSPLMATKAAFDSRTYPWLRANLRKQLGDGQMIVLLNDYADNALAFHTRLIMTA